jgi:hypothetical protein
LSNKDHHQSPPAVGRTIWDVLALFIQKLGGKGLLAVSVAGFAVVAFLHIQTPAGEYVRIFDYPLYRKNPYHSETTPECQENSKTVYEYWECFTTAQGE